MTDLQSNSYFANVYVKTHMRATAYIFGLVAGYLVHIMQQKKYDLPTCGTLQHLFDPMLVTLPQHNDR